MTKIESPGRNISPAPIVDEKFFSGEGVYLVYRCFDPKGNEIVYMELPRSVSPELISESLEKFVESLLETSENIDRTELAERIKTLRMEAKRVPGLHKP